MWPTSGLTSRITSYFGCLLLCVIFQKGNKFTSKLWRKGCACENSSWTSFWFGFWIMERERGNEGLKSLWIFAWKLCRTPGWACWGYVISTFSEVGACIYVYWNGYMYVYIETGYICREQVYLLSCTSMPMPRGCWKMWMFCSSCFLGGFLCVCMGVLVFSCRFLCYCFLEVCEGVCWLYCCHSNWKLWLVFLNFFLL